MKRTRINLADKSQKTLFRRFISNIAKHPLLYIMALPVILYYLVYHYYPMYGMLIAFFDYAPMKGMWGSKFVGMKHFQAFLQDPYFFRTMWAGLKFLQFIRCNNQFDISHNWYGTSKSDVKNIFISANLCFNDSLAGIWMGFYYFLCSINRN